jgi:hypothetical protein
MKKEQLKTADSLMQHICGWAINYFYFFSFLKKVPEI